MYKFDGFMFFSLFSVETKLFIGTNQKDREASPSDWPVLVSDRLLAIHRGQREPSTITVISLDEQAVNKEMAAYGFDEISELKLKEEAEGNEKAKSGGIPRTSSKESTPGPSSSKEGNNNNNFYKTY